MSAQFGKVGVLYGGRSAERDVSLMSGKGVQQALASAGVDAHLFDTGERSLAELAAEGFDRVFIALHGRYGEDGTIQGALELLGIPYTGSGPMASALAMDKTMTKRVWLQNGLPTPEFEVLDADTELRLVPDRLSLPLIVKPPHEGSTVGITKVVGYSDMKEAYAAAARFDSEVLAEQFITGRELTVAVLVRARARARCPSSRSPHPVATTTTNTSISRTTRSTSARQRCRTAWLKKSPQLPLRPIRRWAAKAGAAPTSSSTATTGRGCLK